MPKKNGKEAYAEIKAVRPGVKVLFMSGYTADIIESKGTLAEGIPFLSKPIIPEQQLRKVREVLNS
jgi:CheY-like chemotaxis protein